MEGTRAGREAILRRTRSTRNRWNKGKLPALRWVLGYEWDFPGHLTCRYRLRNINDEGNQMALTLGRWWDMPIDLLRRPSVKNGRAERSDLRNHINVALNPGLRAR